MNKIINILNQEGQLVVTSRQISEDFEKEHSSVVVRAIENLIKELEGSRQNCTHLFIETQYQNEQNKQWYKEYLLTRDGFSLLVMGFTGAKALTWKLKYIEAFNKMEQAIKEIKSDSYMIEDPISRARRWIEEQEEKVKLKEQRDRLIHQNKLYTTSEIAKELGLSSATKLNNLLADRKIQYKQNGTWLLYSKYSEKEFVSIKQQPLDNGKIIYDRKWTGKGRDFILNIFEGEM